jgi:hypothetical protein
VTSVQALHLGALLSGLKPLDAKDAAVVSKSSVRSLDSGASDMFRHLLLRAAQDRTGNQKLLQQPPLPKVIEFLWTALFSNFSPTWSNPSHFLM